MTLNNVAKGTIISIGGQASVVFLAFAFQFALAWLFSAENVGLFAVSLSLFSLAVLIAMFGMNTVVLREVSIASVGTDINRRRDIIERSLLLVVMISFTVAGIILASSNYIANVVYNEPNLTSLLRVFAVSIPFMAIALVLSSVLQPLGYLHLKVILEYILIPGLKLLTLFVAALLFSKSILAVAYGFMVVYGIACVASYIILRLVAPFPILNKQSLRSKNQVPLSLLLFMSWPLVLTDLVYRALQEIQFLILGTMLAFDDVGVYFMTVRLSMLITLFLTASSLVLAPIIANLHDTGDMRTLSNLFKSVTRWAFTLSIPPFILLVGYSEEVLSIFGAEYQIGSTALRILSVSALINVMTGSLGWVLIMTNRARFNLVLATLSLILNIVLIYLLVPFYAVVGAAAASFLSLLLINIITLVLVFKLVGLHPFSRALLKPLAAGFFTFLLHSLLTRFIIILPANLGVAVFGTIDVVTYIIILSILGFDSEDLAIFARAKLRINTIAKGSLSINVQQD